MTTAQALQKALTPSTPVKARRSWTKVSMGTAVVLLAAWGTYALVGLRAPAPDGKLEDVAKYVASERFADLPHDRQKAYMESLSWEKLRDLAPEDRRGVAEAMREFRERETVRNYMAMTPAERRQHIDEVIKAEEERRAQWEQRRAEWQAQRPEGQPPREGRPGGEGQAQGQGQGRPQGGWAGRNSPEREKARLENRDPAMRAASAQYRADMAQRRAELGLPSGGGPGGGGGWGGGQGRGPR